eukprot:2957356-Prymnesium_polylepis.1
MRICATCAHHTHQRTGIGHRCKDQPGGVARRAMRTTGVRMAEPQSPGCSLTVFRMSVLLRQM